MKQKILAGGLVLVILGMLVLSGGANAFGIDIQPDNNQSTAGQVMNFHITLTDIGLINLITVKAGSLTCTFDEEGNVIGTCDSLELKKLSEHEKDSGYGYGYGYGTSKDIKYKVTLQRSALGPGDYVLDFKADTDDGSGSQTSAFSIKAKGKSGK